ncbi:MAG: beta-hydroxyacyl-ACP dehydratase [Bacteroides sp.]|nr:beta-hydroxyacyl-ACP dehydratase [Bacteroides sp.]
MLLENKYYKIIGTKSDGLEAVYRIALLPDCDVYRGHFPGNLVCPGVCNIETIRECASLLAGRRLLISTIKQCRLTAVASPVLCPEVEVTVSLSPIDLGYVVTARIADAERTYMEYKGDMIV